MTRPAADPVRWDRAQWVLVLVLSGNMVLDALEVSVVLPALPAVAADLRLSTFDAQWLMSGFAAGFAAALVVGPALAARFGRRRVYLAAMAVFTAASIVGGLAADPAALVAVRIVKGVCAALTAPAGLALIVAAFPTAAPQRRAVSVYSLFGAAGFTVGLLLAGAVADTAWRAVFLAPAPAALVLLVLALRVVPDERPVLVAHRAALPRSFRTAAVAAAALNGGYIGLLLLVTIGGAERGHPAWIIALSLLPASVPLAVATPFAGRLVARFGTARLIAAGAVAALLGELAFLSSAVGSGGHPGYAAGALPALLLVAAAFVLSFAALNLAATADITGADRPRAVATYQVAVQLGTVAVIPALAGLLTTAGAPVAAAVLPVAGLAGLAAALATRVPRAVRPAPTRKARP